jgi:hypothetical protein
MSTVLRLISRETPYIFESLGLANNSKESKLFPIGSQVELTSGKFPLTNYENLKSPKPYIIGGKKVRISGFLDTCVDDEKFGNNCNIKVVSWDLEGGTRRRRRNRRSRRRAH